MTKFDRPLPAQPCTFEPSKKKQISMATFLKYENGQLLPVHSEFNAAKKQAARLSGDSVIKMYLPVNKIFNLLILLVVAINTLLTVLIAAKIS